MGVEYIDDGLPFDLVIFDCDGVLVNTEKIQLSIMADMVQALGGTLTSAAALTHFRGGKMADHLHLIEQDYLNRPLPSNFEATLRQAWEVAFRQRLTPIDGVEPLLQQLNRPKCVASNGPLAKMQLTLSLTGLIGYFDNNLFSAYDIGHWKPDPTIYLHVAKVMGVHPNRCAVVEDSPVGVQAAVTAGMTVFGFTENEQGEALKAAGANPFTKMDDLLALMRR